MPATEGKKVIKDNNEQEEAPIDRETDNTNEDWVQTRAAANEVQPDDTECLVKEIMAAN